MSVFYFIKTGFFLLVMLFAIIITIWMIRSRKQRERDGSVDPIMDMVNQMGGIGSEFDKMVLDVNPKYRLKKDPQRIYWILLFEILSFLVVIVSMIRKDDGTWNIFQIYMVNQNGYLLRQRFCC